MVIRCLPAGTAARDGVPVVFRRADRIGCCGQLFRLRDLSDPDPWLHPGQLPGGLFGGGYLQYLPDHREILRHRVGDYVCTRFLHRLFPCVPAAQPNLANSAPAPLLDTVLDLDRNSHDRLDPAARSQWSRQPLAAGDRRRRRTTGMAALLRVRRHSRLRPSLHADDDRADLQLDDADRPIADRGRQRCGRQYIAGAVVILPL